MWTIGLSEAKPRLSEILTRVGKGEHIGITRRGKLVAVVVSPDPKTTIAEVFRKIEQLRKRVRRGKNASVRRLLAEGRV